MGYFPRGESPPRHNPPPPVTPHSRMIQVRPEKTLYYILFYLSTLRLVPPKWILYQGYILHYKILVFLHFTYTPLLPAHPPPNIPYYKTYVIHGIIAHKQTNLLLWLEYVF